MVSILGKYFSFLPYFSKQNKNVLKIIHTSYQYSTSSLSFTVLPSKFNNENYLKIKDGYNQICVNEKAWKTQMLLPGTQTTEVKER